MHPITERIIMLESEKVALEDKIHSVILEIQDIQRTCEHRDESGNTTYKQSSYDGLSNIYECSICKRHTRKKP